MGNPSEDRLGLGYAYLTHLGVSFRPNKTPYLIVRSETNFFDKPNFVRLVCNFVPQTKLQTSHKVRNLNIRKLYSNHCT